MESKNHPPKDRDGRIVKIGDSIRLISLSGNWLEELPIDEKYYVLSMIGGKFTVESIDSYGKPWIRKSWSSPEKGECHSHSIAVDDDEMELVSE